MKEVLKLEHIQKYYGNGGNVTKAIQDISFSVEEGEFVGIMGASGSGKTTLLNCISTIDAISAGKILLDGVSVADLSESELAKFRRERLGFVFQDFNLLDTLTIEENIGLALPITDILPFVNRILATGKSWRPSIGITCFEAIAARLPILAWQPFLKQEQENANFLVRRGMARIAAKEESACLAAIRDAIYDDEALSAMERAMDGLAAELGRTAACAAIRAVAEDRRVCA